MELEDAVRIVLDNTNTAMNPDADEALEMVKAHFRTYGMAFEGDDALGEIEPQAGDTVIFVPIADNPPADRPALIKVAISAKIRQCVGGPGDFPYLIELNDRAGTRFYASREELQIIKQAGAAWLG